MNKKRDLILALISGLLLVPAFPPVNLYPLAWFALAPLLAALRGHDRKSSFLLGLLTGLAYFLGTVYWVFHSMFYYGHIPAALSVLIVMILCLYLAVYTGVFAMVFSWVREKHALPAALTVPVIWVTLEFLRTYALTGFPWSLLGYSQHRALPLIQIADLTGIYGVSFIVAAINGALFDIFTYVSQREDTDRVSLGKPAAGTIFVAVLITATLAYGIFKLNESDEGGKLRVSVVQGNIPQDKKWDYTFQSEVINTYKRLTMETVPDDPDLIVWPETAVPFIFGNDEELTGEITSFQKDLGVRLLFGSVLVRNNSNRTVLSNSALLMSPEGNITSVYDKIHLVPYGEYVPLSELFPFIKKLVVAIGDFAPGTEAVVMETPSAKIGNLICYEIIFPGLVRKFADNGANVLVTITNDAWFGHTSAPYQHFSMAVFRAVENRVPVVRSANTGISGFIDSRGRIMKQSDIFVEDALTGEISIGSGKSIYAEYGDIFALACIGGFVILAVRRVYIR